MPIAPPSSAWDVVSSRSPAFDAIADRIPGIEIETETRLGDPPGERCGKEDPC